MAFDADTIAALQKGALILVDFLTIHGWDSEGDPADYCFWTGTGNVVTNVVDARDGSTKSRSFVGDGALLTVPDIVDGVGLEARTAEFGLNPLHTSIRDMVYGGRIRAARVEHHRGLRDVSTGALVSTPFPYLLGRVDRLINRIPAVGEDGTATEASMTLEVIGDQIDLTRTNPALKSDEQQKLRGGDRLRQDADTAGQYDVWWGQARGTD